MSNDEHNPIFGDPFQALVDHFDAADIRYTSNRKERRLWFTMNSGNALQKCSFRFDKTGEVLQIFIQYPVMVKEKFRPIAMEFITRANYGLVLGSFDFDNSDGETKFRVSYPMTDRKLEDDIIHKLFSTALGTAGRYFPALMQVIYGGSTAEDAIYLAELDYHAARVEEPPKKSIKASKVGGPKLKGSKRSRKAPPASESGSSSKAQDDHPTPDSKSQANPPQIPPSAHDQAAPNND